MGRDKKYQNEEERKEAQRQFAREYYNKNKKQIKLKRMEKYYVRRLEEIRENLSRL